MTASIICSIQNKVIMKLDMNKKCTCVKLGQVWNGTSFSEIIFCDISYEIKCGFLLKKDSQPNLLEKIQLSFCFMTMKLYKISKNVSNPAFSFKTSLCPKLRPSLFPEILRPVHVFRNLTKRKRHASRIQLLEQCYQSKKMNNSIRAVRYLAAKDS